jgi:hypothetical protein
MKRYNVVTLKGSIHLNSRRTLVRALTRCRADGARPTMLRAPLTNTAAAKNMIPLPTENTPSVRSILRNHL